MSQQVPLGPAVFCMKNIHVAQNVTEKMGFILCGNMRRSYLKFEAALSMVFYTTRKNICISA